MHRVTMFAPIGMPGAIWLNMEILEILDAGPDAEVRPATVRVIRSQGKPVYSLNDPHPHRVIYEGAGIAVVQDTEVSSGQTCFYSGLVEWSPGLWYAIVTLSGTAL